MRPVRTATICRNEDDHRDPAHRRVKLRLERDPAGLVWRTSEGEDCLIPPQRTVAAAEAAAVAAWGAPCWDLRARWRR